MKLTENFSLDEMLRSSKADKLKITEQYNPPEEVIENLKDLCVHILQPLREIIGQAVTVTSGYRCLRVNKAVGGVKSSQHLTGQAADIQATTGMTNKQLFEVIRNSDLPFDQLIWEYGNKSNPAWVHVSYGTRRRRQVIYVGQK